MPTLFRIRVPIGGLFTALVAAISLSFVGGSPARAQTQFTNGPTNLRSGPGSNFPVISAIPTGAAVSVGRCSGGWCGVGWRGRSGFVVASRLGGGGRGRVFVPPASFRVGFYLGSPYYFYGGRWFHRGRWYNTRPRWAQPPRRNNRNWNDNRNRNRNVNRNRGNQNRNANRNRDQNRNANRNRANQNRNLNRNRGGGNRGGGNQRRRQRTELAPEFMPLLNAYPRQVLVYAIERQADRNLLVFIGEAS